MPNHTYQTLNPVDNYNDDMEIEIFIGYMG
jgi:hypothetical protein